jgi:hypothetical protein
MTIRKAVSEKRLQANRANSKRSTGPKTLAGKAAVRGNALKHGMRSEALNFRASESMEDFDEMLLELLATGELHTIEEQSLLEKLARIWWKMRRCQSDLPSSKSTSGSDHSIALRLFRRYEVTLCRQLSRHIRRVLELRQIQQGANRE